jgi:hypothetical protein
VRAADADGAAWNPPVTVFNCTTNGWCDWPSLAEVNGNPAVAFYFDNWNSQVRRVQYTRATDSDGANWNTPVIVQDCWHNGNGWCGHLSLADNNGSPAISYSHNDWNANLREVRFYGTFAISAMARIHWMAAELTPAP